MKREEAILVLKELLDGCAGLDGCGLELTPSTSMLGSYQIIIRGMLDETTKNGVKAIAAQHQLTCQIGNFWPTKRTINKTEPDILIIYKPT